MFYLFPSGVINHVDTQGCHISHLTRTDKTSQNWVFPEEGKVQKTTFKQIICHDILIAYRLCISIHCNDSQDMVEEIQLVIIQTSLNFKKKNFMAPFYGWGSTASRLEPLRGGSLLFTTKFPEIPGTHFIDLGRMKG